MSSNTVDDLDHPEEMPDETVAWVERQVTRDRGFLTPRDRKFLLGYLDDELDANARAQKHYQIRNRLKNAIQDFAFLHAHASDVDQVFEDYTGRSYPPSDEDSLGDFDHAVGDMVHLLMHALGRDVFLDLVADEIAWCVHHSALENGEPIKEVEVNISPDIDPHMWTLDESEERLKQGEPVESIELEQLLDAGRITIEEIAEHHPAFDLNTRDGELKLVHTHDGSVCALNER